jgi:hypothetical protein
LTRISQPRQNRENALSLAAIRAWWESRTGWEKTALVVWSAILLVVCVRVYGWPVAKTVYPIYSASGYFWWSGTDLYAPARPDWAQGGYRYSPTFAILCVPFALFPDNVGGVVWRLLCTASFLGSLTWLARSLSTKPLSRDYFALLLLFCVPLSLQSINNGQANILVIAALLAAVAAVKEQRWNLVGAAVALVFVCKIYPLALGLLLMVLYPRQLSLRIPLGVAASLLLPFLLQNPAYGAEQYRKWFTVLYYDDRSTIDLDQAYRDLWLLIRLYALPVSRQVYVLAQLLAGAGIALVCWHRQRTGWPEKQLLISTLALGVTWMVLLGPTTESCSFILLAPSLSWSMVEAMRSDVSKGRQALLWGSVAFFGAAVTLADFKWVINVHAVGVHSWASLFYFVYLLTQPPNKVNEISGARFVELAGASYLRK